MKTTYQQQVIYEAVKALGTHPSAERVYEDVVRQHPTISRATVYRNLNQMAETGKLVNIGKIDGATRFDHNCHPHYHFECKVCKRIFDVEGHIADLCRQVKCPEDFDVEGYVINFRGACKECKES